LNGRQYNHSGFDIYFDVSCIPDCWDEIAGDNLFLTKKILGLLQMINPCSQKYHMYAEKKIILVTYKLKVDLLSLLSRSSLKIPINIIGIPLSVAFKGYQASGEGEKILSQYLNAMKGINIVLNGDEGLNLLSGYSLSNFALDIEWRTMKDYLSSMRSHYRYKFTKAIQKFQEVKAEKLEDNGLFSDDMYALYLEVYENSKEKLEKLSIDYFRQSPFPITVFRHDDRLLGFIQTTVHNEELLFLFCGFNHLKNQHYDLYTNMLLYMVMKGIEEGRQRISFGQTTEQSKSIIGAQEVKKRLYIASKSKLIRFFSKALIRVISYQGYGISHRVFTKKGRC